MNKWLDGFLVCLDWVGTLDSVLKTASPDWETKTVNCAGMTPNDRARFEGKGWEAGFVDYSTGEMEIHRKIERK